MGRLFGVYFCISFHKLLCWNVLFSDLFVSFLSAVTCHFLGVSNWSEMSYLTKGYKSGWNIPNFRFSSDWDFFKLQIPFRVNQKFDLKLTWIWYAHEKNNWRVTAKTSQFFPLKLKKYFAHKNFTTWKVSPYWNTL